MVEPGNFGHLHLFYHFTVLLKQLWAKKKSSYEASFSNKTKICDFSIFAMSWRATFFLNMSIYVWVWVGEYGVEIIFVLFFVLFLCCCLLFFHGWYMIVCCVCFIVPFLLPLSLVPLNWCY